MANDLTNFSPELWSTRIQNLLEKNLVGGMICSVEEQGTLKFGDRVHRPYHSDPYPQSYTKGTAYTEQDIETTDEYLDVDQTKVIPLYVDYIDDIQNKYATIDKLTARSSYRLKDQIDQTILGNVQYSNLGNTTAVTLATNNVFSTASNAKASMTSNGVENDRPWFWVVDPDSCSILEQFMGANGFKVADDVLMNGYGMKTYKGEAFGLQIAVSQNLPSTYTLGLATQPTDGDTVTVGGVTFTFKTTLGTTAGNVLIDGSADNANTNLAKAINDSGTAGTHYYQLSTANRRKLKNKGVSATANLSPNTQTITGYGSLNVSETLTDGTDGFTTKNISNIICRQGAIDLVIQKQPNVDPVKATDRLGHIIRTWDLYGTKMFEEGQERSYKLLLNCA